MRQLQTTLIGLAFLVAGCSSDKGAGPQPQQGSITLAITPASATVQQGGSTQITGTIVRTNFTGDVAIAVTGVPTGVTGSVTLAPTNGGNSAQVTIAAASNAPPGTYPLKVVASGSGITSREATFTLTIAPATPASFSMAMQNTVSIAQGATEQLTIDFTRTNFTGPITLAAENLPTGVTPVFSANPVNGNQATLSLSATNSAAPGTFTTVLVRGSAPGLTDVTLPLTITVTVTGNFTINTTSSALTVARGNAVNTNVNVVRTGGFTGIVAFNVTGPANAALPAGLTATVTPTGTADQHTLTVTTTSALDAATYPLVVHATSAGVAEQVANVSVTVTAPAVVTLDFSVCNVSERPHWVAVQDGNGAFMRVNGIGDVYTFGIESDRGAVATVFNNSITEVKYFAKSEAATEASTISSGCTSPVVGKSVSGTVAGGAGYTTTVSLGARSVLGNNLTNFQLTGVASGAQSLVAYRRLPPADGGAADLYIVRRNQDIANGGAIPLLDFTSGAEAKTPSSAVINITGSTAADQLSHSVTLMFGPGCIVPALPLYSKEDAAPAVYAYGLQPADLLATDFYRLQLTNRNTTTGLRRSVDRTTKTLVNGTIALSSEIAPAVSIVNVAQTYRRIQSAVTISSDYQSAMLNYFDLNGKTFIVRQTPGYIAGQPNVTLIAPDLSAVAGYQLSWAPSMFSAITHTTTVEGSTGGSLCTDGRLVRRAALTGNILLN